MKKLLLILTLPIFLFASCNKKESTLTKVGFYFEDKNATGDMSYDLYIDDKFEGKINVCSDEPTDPSLFLFVTLDSKRHDIDVKDGSTLLTASYLEITKKKTCSGTNKNKTLQVNGNNGFRYRKDSNKDYAVFAAFK